MRPQILVRLAPVLAAAGASLAPVMAVPRQPDVVEPAAARSLASLVLLDLNAVGSPLPRDYAIASWTLEAASALAPRDEQILRLLIDATSEAGDRERVIAQSLRLLTLDTADTVALLRVISGRISALQDADARLAAYDKALFGARAQDLDPSVRSRLALDGALLLRERGDLEGFASRLALASELDSTNKDAASLAVAFYSQRQDDGPGRLQLLLNLLLADPLDADTHLAIARELAAGGDDEDALRFFGYVQAIFRATGRKTPPGVEAEAQTSVWNIQGPESLVQILRAEVEQARAQVAEARRAGQADAPDPAGIGLSLELERVRTAAASSLGDDAQLDYAFGELLRNSQAALDSLNKMDPPPTGDALATRDRRIRSIESELNWMRLWCGRQTNDAALWLDRVRADPESDPPTVSRLDGWLRLRRGDFDGSERELAPLAAADPLAALGLAALAEQRGNSQDAIDRYAALSRQLAGTLAGAWARSRATKLAGGPPDPPADAARLKEIVATVPEWLGAMIASPRDIASLQAFLPVPRIGVLESGEVSVRLRNLASAPLGMGPERPINTRLLLVPSVTLGLEPVTGAPVTVVRLDRRLRLLPQESVEARVWATGGPLGWFLDDFAGTAAQVRWQLLQGFVITEEGLYRAGPLNTLTTTGVMSIARCPRVLDAAAGLVRWIETGAESDVAESLLAVRWKLNLPADDTARLSPEDAKTVGDALARRYPTLSQAGRVLATCLLPPGQDQEWIKPVDAVIAEEANPVVLAAVLLARVTDPQSPVLARAAASGDARLSPLIEHLRLRLPEDGLCFAKMRPKTGQQAPPAATKGSPSGGAAGAGGR